MPSFDIQAFLELYQQYPCLWDKSIPDFKDRQNRAQAEEVLLQFTGLENIKALRAKIRSIRGTFNNEVRKVLQSRKCGRSEVYKPKLIWYEYAYSFLGKNLESELETDTNFALDITEQKGNNFEMFSDNIIDVTLMEDKQQSSSSSAKEYVRDPLSSSPECHLKMPSPKSQSRQEYLKNSNLREKEKPKGDSLSREMLDNLQDSMINNEFTLFGLQVGVVLNKLSLSKALQVQKQIQELLCDARLSELNGIRHTHSFK